ncbi:ankyrin repeat domain-containing protein [Nocardia brasiliensis]
MDTAHRCPTPLHEAAHHNDIRRVVAEINNGAEVNATDEHGLTPLHYAARQDAVDAARLLLLARADVHARTDSGQTPLTMASQPVAAAHRLVYRLLLTHDAQPLPASVDTDRSPRTAPRSATTASTRNRTR